MLQRLEGYQNPAFCHQTSDILFSLLADEEEVAFEHSEIKASKPYEKHRNHFAPPTPSNEQYCTTNVNTQQQVSIKKFDNNIGPFYTPRCDAIDKESDNRKWKATSSIIRKKYVSGKKPMVPPRPLITDTSQSSDTSPDRPQLPNLPTVPLTKYNSTTCNDETTDLIFDSDSSDTSAMNKSFLADFTFEDSYHVNNSPVSTLPSADLLGLEESLFHETMQSVSDDTRSLMITSVSTPSVHSNSDTLPNFQRSKAFFDKKNVFPNYKLVDYSNNSRVPERGKVVNSTTSELFANCYEEAKNIKYTPR